MTASFYQVPSALLTINTLALSQKNRLSLEAIKYNTVDLAIKKEKFEES